MRKQPDHYEDRPGIARSPWRKRDADAARASRQAYAAGAQAEEAANSLVTSDRLADAAVTTAKLANLAVDVTKLADLSVQAAKLADSAVTATKIANAAVGSAAIASAAIGSAHIANAAILSAHIGSAVIQTAHIGDAQITSAKIVSLSADKISAGTIQGSIFLTGYTNGFRIKMGDYTMNNAILWQPQSTGTGATIDWDGTRFWLSGPTRLGGRLDVQGGIYSEGLSVAYKGSYTSGGSSQANTGGNSDSTSGNTGNTSGASTSTTGGASALSTYGEKPAGSIDHVHDLYDHTHGFAHTHTLNGHSHSMQGHVHGMGHVHTITL